MEFAKYAVFKVGNTHYERYYNQCGFKSPEEFYSEFKKYANMTVEEYLNLVWAKIGCRQKPTAYCFIYFQFYTTSLPLRHVSYYYSKYRVILITAHNTCRIQLAHTFFRPLRYIVFIRKRKIRQIIIIRKYSSQNRHCLCTRYIVIRCKCFVPSSLTRPKNYTLFIHSFYSRNCPLRYYIIIRKIKLYIIIF